MRRGGRETPSLAASLAVKLKSLCLDSYDSMKQIWEKFCVSDSCKRSRGNALPAQGYNLIKISLTMLKLEIMTRQRNASSMEELAVVFKYQSSS